MAASLQPTSSKTTILDLNDDCLRGVFAYMDPMTLSTAADVCTRFKQNTMHAALLTIKEIRFRYVKEPPVYAYSMLRNFGEFIEKIEVVGHVEEQIIKQLSSHCVKKSIELIWNASDITDEIALLLRPLLGRVQKLRLLNCRVDEVLLRNLSFWLEGLQESEYGVSKPIHDNEKQFDRLSQKNLKSLEFDGVQNVGNAYIEEFLQQNPQLKEIELFDCESLDSCVLESIARNVPAIEKIGFVMHWKRKPSNRDHINYLRQLHKLKSLTLGALGDDSYVQSIVHEIASVNTGLDYLDLSHFDLRHNVDQFIGGISKQQQLKTLRLHDVQNMTAAHLIEICKHAKELSVIVIYFKSNVPTTNNDLMEIVKNASQLQEFTWIAIHCLPEPIPTNIDANTFHNLAKLVDQRNEKTSLCIELPRWRFTSTIPADLLAAVNNLKIELC